ncbi:type II secretion system F family protein [Neoactinobaculum massilliense]|uniref:type II secretion system F family protein n=1 Tax=Neoactinobaculum massilliense TaxID=2364794 RepID=UPI000F520F61|nr:type II secretion system F family protein [Neoactinobaculum massilliense]
MGALVGGCLALGAVLLGIWLANPRPSIARRVLPYMDEGWSPRSRHGWVRRVVAFLGALGSTTASVRARVTLLGSTVADFRAKQLRWALLSGLLGALLVLVSLPRGFSLGVALLLPAAGMLGGAIAADSWLTRAASAHRSRVVQELPDAVDLLALGVGAGASILGSLEQVANVGSGVLGEDLRRLVADVNSGTPLREALESFARRVDVTPVDRLVEALITALDRGTPLVTVLEDQAADSRDLARRELLERGGKQEVAMMVPVIFIVLPITVVFTFYPALMQLTFLT